MLIRDAFREFILACQADNFSLKTIKWYKDMLTHSQLNLMDWLTNRNRTELEAITTSNLREYVVWLREQKSVRTGKALSEYTINAILRCLHRFFRWCSEEFQIPNPMKRIKYPKNPEPTPKAIKLETALALILSCGDDMFGVRNRAMLLFFMSTGARREGVASLTIERLDLANRAALVIEKGNKRRVVPFDDLTAEALNEWMKIRDPEEYVFYNVRSRERLTGDGVYTIIRKLALKNGITGRSNPHGWRHLFAELYHQAGGSLASLSKLMGHKTTRVTAETYLNFAMQTAIDEYEQHNPMGGIAEALKNQKPKTEGSGF